MNRKLLLATAAATLAFAAPAAANPSTDVGPLSGPGGHIDLAGNNSGLPAEIDWDLQGGQPNPVLDGRLFMDNTPGAQARVRVQWFDNLPNHALLSTQDDPLRSGVAGQIAAFGTNIGPQPGSAHAHVQLILNGSVESTGFCTMGNASCTVVP